MDTVSTKRRSEIMSQVRSRDTRPELTVRRLIHAMGYRYRLHAKDLPGKPDIVFRVRRKVIFIHGCFWHRHTDCALARLPKSREDFWLPKLDGNKLRDMKVEEALRKDGWTVLTVWECELGDIASLKNKIEGFLDAKR